MSILSPVEKTFLSLSEVPEVFAEEAVCTLQVRNVYELGKLISLRFLEWVQMNPSGVVALPTGRTPEFFIKTLERYKNHWGEKEVQDEVQRFGLTNTEMFPNTSSLRFVMLDEFFPISSTHRNSFCRYIRTFYTTLLNIPEENVLTFDFVHEGVITESEMHLFHDNDNVDIDLLHREAVNEQEKAQKLVLEKIHQFCQDYERRVHEMGGIGFFLGGIGPDGHIAFNQHGESLSSTTRLVKFNYPSAAAAAGDLGGIENSRGKAAVTIGLKTITAKKDATIIILVSGEGKAKLVRQALEDNDTSNPSTALHSCEGARFYITSGAACHLSARRGRVVKSVNSKTCLKWALGYLSGVAVAGGEQPALKATPPPDYSAVEEYIYNLSLRLKIPVHDLTVSNMCEDESNAAPELLKNEMTCQVLVATASRRLRDKVDAGVRAMSQRNQCFLHTAPHHDDIMLSYHAAMHQILGRRTEAPLNPPPSKQSKLSSIPDVSSDDDEEEASSSFGLLGTEVSTAGSRLRSGSRSSQADESVTQNHSGAPQSEKYSADAVLGEEHGNNVNHFAYLTSGFHSVNEDYIRDHCRQLLETCTFSPSETVLEHIVRDGQITRVYDELLSEFRVTFFEKRQDQERLIEHILFLRNICSVWGIVPTSSYRDLCLQLTEKVSWLLNNYVANHNPGDSIPPEIQLFKGSMRESEVDRVWALSRMPNSRVHHLRSKFYTDDFFTPMPSLEDDAMPLANLIRSRQPSVVTVALDPEGTGPDTHYKVLLVVAASLRISIERGDLLREPNPLVWGYRNVWFEFKPSDATLMFPVSASDLDLMHDTFMSCFTTQKKASFPSPYFDGPFSAWARQIQKRQHRMLRVLLGDNYFTQHSNPLMRHSSGFIFVKAMYADQFLSEVEHLKSKLEN